jgi:3-dehydroquinate synthase
MFESLPDLHWCESMLELNKALSPTIEEASIIYILTDENVYNIWGNDLVESCSSLAHSNFIVVPAGEQCKTWDILGHVIGQLTEDAADRKSVLINFGGGTITDLGGLVASIYKRGIDFVHIPTTLMGMIDAAIGGKNAINFETTKNCIGTFQHPDSLIIAPFLLTDLPQKEILSAFAEMLKHALIADESLWKSLCNLDNISIQTLAPFIKRNIQIKNKIVLQDPYEENIRKFLNFGHTLGHVFESHGIITQKNWSHGQCVAWGMELASIISTEVGKLNPNMANEIIENLISWYGTPPDLNHQVWSTYIFNDKKTEFGEIKMILLDNIGYPSKDNIVSLETILESQSKLKSSFQHELE